MANVTNVGQDAVDAGASGVKRELQGGINSVSDRRHADDGALAYGEIVSFWHPDAGVKFAEASRPNRV